MERQETALLIAVIVLVVIITIMISLFLIFQKRKNSLLLHQKEAEKKYEQAIAETEIEIREQTLRNISWELHDNIGQLLTLAKIQVGMAKDKPERLPEVTETISKSLTELRALSKLINPDALKNLSLIEALELEIERFNRLQFIKASLKSTPETKSIDKKAGVIIFRILQEFFSNTIKHSKASELTVKVIYATDSLKIHAQDNGIGFDIKDQSSPQGIGLCNIKNRAKLINANVEIQSKKGDGTEINVEYFFEKPSSVENLT